MNRALGVWTSEDCALVLIDFQNVAFLMGELDSERRAA
jgi:hypothetical protein